MRILYLSGEDMRKEGGGKTHFIEVARNLQNLGNDILVVIPGYWPRDGRNYNLNIRYVPTFKKNVFSYLIYEFINMFYLIYYILNFKPDVIYSRSVLLDIMHPIIARLMGVPYVIEKNGIMEDEFRVRGINEIIIKVLRVAEQVNLFLSKMIVCVTKEMKNEFARRYKISSDKMKVIANGVNVDLFRPLDKHECRRRLNLEENVFYVGFIGSFTPWQGVEDLIEVSNKLKIDGYSQIKYLLIGDGELETDLIMQVHKYGIEDRIILKGRVNYKDVPGYINAFDICYLGKKGLSFGFSPLKLYEYLACARPVIASRFSGIIEVIDEGGCGYLFEPGNVDELAERIIQGFKQQETLKTIGLKGRRLVENKYSWRVTAEKVQNVLMQIRRSC
jgi:glycosyltransferase involved in cell wall biosynthesis